MDLDADEHVLSERHDDDADDLRSVNSVDTLEGLQAEQTWPTADELASAPAALSGGAGHLPDAPEGTTPRLKRVPKGTSAYQAAWILEDDASDDDGDESVMDEDGASDLMVW
jgi:pre-rRNA-processing protein TSR1